MIETTSNAARGQTLTGLDVLRDAAAGNLPAPPCAALLGWRALSLEPGRVKVEFSAREDFYNPQGAVQGGLLTAMLDDTMGPAGYTLLDAGQFAPTLELKVNFLRPARAGKLVGEGWVVHKGASILFLEGRLTTKDGTLIATASATARIFTAPINGE